MRGLSGYLPGSIDLSTRYVTINMKRGSSYTYTGKDIVVCLTYLKTRKLNKVEVLDGSRVILKSYAKNVDSIEEGYN